MLILGYPNVPPHFINSYKEIIVSDMLLDCFQFLKRPGSAGKRKFLDVSPAFSRFSSNNYSHVIFSVGRGQSRTFSSSPHSSHQSRGTFNHPGDVRSSGSPSSGFNLPQLSANVVIILIAQYLATLPENATICKDQLHQLIQNSKELFWQTHQEISTIQPFFLTIGKHINFVIRYLID